MRILLYGELQALAFRHMLEGRFHKCSDLIEAYIDEVGRDIAGLDLGKVENIINELYEVITAAMDGLCKPHLFFGEVTILVLEQLLREYQQGVKRCPQLMRHIRKELRFVFRSQGQLFRFFFERFSCLFHFLILIFHLFFLLNKKVCFILQVFIGALQLICKRS